MGFMWFRFWQILRSAFYDIVIVRRELLMFNDYGNLFFEKFLSAIHAKRILDFDDDIATAKKEPRKISYYGKLLMEKSKKFSESLKRYTHFFPGTNYLNDLLKQSFTQAKSENCLVLPTCVDYDFLPKKNYSSMADELIIGWVGARNNLHNLHIITNSLNLLASKYKFRLLVICDSPFIIPAYFPIDFIRWNEKNEIENLLKIDVGIMPLENTMEQKGKCGFKLIQYMGCGIVSMATALTVNNEIINDGVNGFLVPPDADWTSYIEKVFQSRNQFAEIGKSAIEKILTEYSFNSNQSKLISFLNKIAMD
ncbi:glycosyl transferase [Bacteroidota bacterium]|nr:glycosyl transferase [Bacteroidota bacterium]